MTPAIHLDRVLRERFGFDQFRPGQRDVINAVLTRGRALAVFPTGAGKSMCYQLPALVLEGVTVVVSPLIALMKDQIDFLTGRGIEARRIDSSLSTDEFEEVSRTLRERTLKLLYVAPERFNNERFRRALERIPISLFAIDEAHCISEWGHNFRPDYLKLAEIARALGAVRVLTLTATATPSVVNDIRAAFDIPPECAVVTGFYRSNLKLAITPVSRDEREGVLLKRLRKREPGPTIVYVTLQQTAERVAGVLRDAGLAAEAYHAGMEAEARSLVQDRWMAGDRGIIVATIAFGMGIDKSDVRAVYHYNLPKSLESYSQEIGRAGRDGKPSVVEMLACADDVATLENFAYGDTPTEASLRSLVEELLGLGEEFSVSLGDLSSKHDLRLLVLRTALTYLELLGVFRQGTPFYAGYKVQPKRTPEEIAATFRGEPAEFILDMFRHAKRGRRWFTLDLERAIDRARLVRALEVLEERGLAEVVASDMRHRFYRERAGAKLPRTVDALTQELLVRFVRREEQEIERLRQVVSLVDHAACHTNALVAHFGERRAVPCGHCLPCLGVARRSFQSTAASDGSIQLDEVELRSLRETHDVLRGDPRRMARFLCGLGSPALTRAKLTRHPLFGSLEERSFRDVLALCTSLGAV